MFHKKKQIRIIINKELEAVAIELSIPEENNQLPQKIKLQICPGYRINDLF